MKDLKRLLFWLSLALTGVAVLTELLKPPHERRWHGSVFGVVPYDFRPPSFNRFKAAWWNPDDKRLFTPRDFGVGWAVNLARALELVRRGLEKDTAEEAVPTSVRTPRQS